MDKMREEFEDWFIDNYCHGAGPVNNGSAIAMAAWNAWKASRAALNAELDIIDARIKRECEKADYLKAACAKIIDDINSIQIERF